MSINEIKSNKQNHVKDNNMTVVGWFIFFIGCLFIGLFLLNAITQ